MADGDVSHHSSTTRQISGQWVFFAANLQVSILTAVKHKSVCCSRA
jgi:hypothetical protein